MAIEAADDGRDPFTASVAMHDAAHLDTDPTNNTVVCTKPNVGSCNIK